MICTWTPGLTTLKILSALHIDTILQMVKEFFKSVQWFLSYGWLKFFLYRQTDKLFLMSLKFTKMIFLKNPLGFNFQISLSFCVGILKILSKYPTLHIQF